MILEGLVTSTDNAGRPHLAPMGPTVFGDFDRLLLRPFPTSNTCENLTRRGEGVFHVTDDARLIAYAAVGKMRDVPPTNLATTVAGFVLNGACRAFEFRVTEIDATRERVHISAAVVHRHSLREWDGFNRAKHAVIEAAILATRFHLLPADEIAGEFKKLRVIVDKTGSDAEHDAMGMLEAEWAKFQEGKG